MIKLSNTSKLDCKSWSLQALETCAGSRKENGELVDACKGCYATTGFYGMPSVKKVRDFNKQDWKRTEWVADMVLALDNERYFRWFDSGDIYSLRLAWKMYEVMQQTPWVRHWLPTRMEKHLKYKNVIAKMRALPNVVVRWSSDSVVGEFSSEHGSTIIPNASEVPNGATLCEAYNNNGKCNGCKKCWDKSIPVIAYVGHGQTMKKVINIAKG